MFSNKSGPSGFPRGGLLVSPPELKPYRVRLADALDALDPTQWPADADDADRDQRRQSLARTLDAYLSLTGNDPPQEDLTSSQAGSSPDPTAWPADQYESEPGSHRLGDWTSPSVTDLFPAPVIPSQGQSATLNYNSAPTQQIGIVGDEGARGAWGIAQSLAGPEASNAQINHFKNQLLGLNPELAGEVRRGQHYRLPDFTALEDRAAAVRADSRYQDNTASGLMDGEYENGPILTDPTTGQPSTYTSRPQAPFTPSPDGQSVGPATPESADERRWRESRERVDRFMQTPQGQLVEAANAANPMYGLAYGGYHLGEGVAALGHSNLLEGTGLLALGAIEIGGKGRGGRSKAKWEEPENWQGPAATKGSWKGQRGNSEFLLHDDFARQLGLPKGSKVTFRNGVPDYSSSAISTPAGNPGSFTVDGLTYKRSADRRIVIRHLAKESKMTTQQVEKWLSDNKIHIHHYRDDIIQLVPQDLHTHVHHTGPVGKNNR